MLRKGGLTFDNWINFTLGNGSYLYFNTVLLLMFILFYNINTVKAQCTLLVLGLTMIIYQSEILKSYSNYTYLNPFVWCGWFAVGQMLKNNPINLEVIFKYRVLWYIAYPVILIYTAYKNTSIGYWSSHAVVIEVIAIFFVMNVAPKGGKCMGWIGRRTFLIYLIHMPIAGIVSNIMNRFMISAIITVFRPMLVLVLTAGCIMLLEYSVNKIGVKTIAVLTGINNKK